MPETSDRGESGRGTTARLRRVFAAATILLVLLLAFFAYSIIHVRQQQRDDLNQRFHDRAAVAAAVTDSLFGTASSQAQIQAAKNFGGPTVNPAALTAAQKQTRQSYIQILAKDGRVLGATPHAPPRPSTDPLVAKALRSGRIQYSGALPGPGGSTIIESATPFPTAYGRRVEVGGSDSGLIAKFLSSFLAKVPNVADARSYVVDSSEKVIGSRGVKVRPGAPLPDRALAAAAAAKQEGGYSGGRYFTSAPIPAVPWQILLTATQANLYASVNGSQRTLPWVIFAAFALSVALGLFLVQRVLRANAELQRAELSRQHALEINDNVVQRLVVAKYALDRGATEMSQEKVTETLRETQQLVTSLLAEKEIEPGVLRRTSPAETDRPPETSPPDGGSK